MKNLNKSKKTIFINIYDNLCDFSFTLIKKLLMIFKFDIIHHKFN